MGEVSGRGRVTLKIDQIRELQQALSLTTTEARYKIAIIKQFDSATIGAANAFLKTLTAAYSYLRTFLDYRGDVSIRLSDPTTGAGDMQVS